MKKSLLCYLAFALLGLGAAGLPAGEAEGPRGQAPLPLESSLPGAAPPSVPPSVPVPADPPPPVSVAPAPTVAALPSGDHWRLVFTERVEAVEGSWQRPTPFPDTLVAVWFWSETVAPTRLLPSELARFAPRPASEVFVHQKSPGMAPSEEPRPRPPAMLIAGPPELWREVPEDLLPHWPWPQSAAELRLPHEPGSRWQARLLDQERGSFWVAPAATAKASRLPLLPARDHQIVVLAASGKPLPEFGIDILRAGISKGSPQLLAIFREERGGQLLLPSLPEAEPIVAIVRAAGHVPLTWQGLPADLPERFRPEPGTAVSGRLVNTEGQPIAGAEITLEAWLAGDFPSFLQRGAVSAVDGSFRLAAVPVGPARMQASSSGFAALTRDLEIPAGGLELGDLGLAPVGRVELSILSANGQPVAAAEVSRQGRTVVVVANPDGRVTIEGADAEQPLALEVRGAGYLPKQVQLFPPFLPLNEIRLAAAFVVEGIFLDEEEQPVVSGSLIAAAGTRSLQRPLGGPTGAFEVALPVDQEFELRLLSAAGSEARVSLAPGRPGERRSLGAVKAAPSRRFYGRLLAASDFSPIAGARLWLPRPGALDDASAFLFGDLIEVTSSADGGFELRGLAAGGSLLRIDSPGFARKSLRLPASEATRVDLGEILLDAGSQLEISAPEARDGVAARLDLGGRWLDLDMLTASVYDGKALFRQVPPGKARLTLVDRGQLLCEHELTIPPSGRALADCRRARVRVSGQVTLGGRPSGAGALTFSSPVGDAPQIIRRQATPGGLHNDRLEGVGRPPVAIAVAAGGHFATDELLPGVWRVGWVSPQLSLGGELQVEIADSAEEAALALDFPAHELRGQVVDPAGHGVAGARVRETGRGLLAFTGENGEFLMAGLEVGESWLVAEKDGERSGAVAARVEENGQAEELVLTLGEKTSEGRVEVQVLLPGENPATAALVFLETTEGDRRMVSANPQGLAVFELERPFPSHLRVGAFAEGRLGLGGLQAFSPAMAPISLQMPENGSLLLHSAFAARPVLENGEGWNVSFWLGRLGRMPVAGDDQELRIENLPAGSYRVNLAGRTYEVAVEAGEVARLEAP